MHTRINVVSTLQVQSTEVLYSGVVSVAQEKCPDMLPHAREVYLCFETAIGLFGKCHDIYNGGVTSERDIQQLGMSKVVQVARYVYM